MVARGDPVERDHRVVALGSRSSAAIRRSQGGPVFQFLCWMPPWVTTPMTCLRNDGRVVRPRPTRRGRPAGSATTRTKGCSGLGGSPSASGNGESMGARGRRPAARPDRASGSPDRRQTTGHRADREVARVEPIVGRAIDAEEDGRVEGLPGHVVRDRQASGVAGRGRDHGDVRQGRGQELTVLQALDRGPQTTRLLPFRRPERMPNSTRFHGSESLPWGCLFRIPQRTRRPSGRAQPGRLERLATSPPPTDVTDRG